MKNRGKRNEEEMGAEDKERDGEGGENEDAADRECQGKGQLPL